MSVTLTITNNSDGTGTYVIAGSSVGATNEIYWSRIELDDMGWELLGSRVGDGSVALTTQPGLKWFYVVSTLGGVVQASAPVPASITATVLAVYERILQSVGTTLQGIVANGLTPLITDITRVQRMDYIADVNKINLQDFKCDVPCIIYGPGLTETFVVGTSLNMSDDFDYPVLVSVIDRKSAEYQANDAAYLAIREAIRNTFNQRRVAGVKESKTTQVQFEIVLDHGQDEQDMHQFASGLRLICSTREIRWS